MLTDWILAYPRAGCQQQNEIFGRCCPKNLLSDRMPEKREVYAEIFPKEKEQSMETPMQSGCESNGKLPDSRKRGDFCKTEGMWNVFDLCKYAAGLTKERQRRFKKSGPKSGEPEKARHSPSSKR